jgi:hypothetical protein
MDADIIDELKRALFLNDEELLEDVLMAHPELSKFKIDPARNKQIIHKAC